MRQATIVCKNLWLRPMRTLLSISGLAIAVAPVVALVGVSRRFEQSFLELYNRRGGDLVVQRSGGAMQLASGIDEHLGEKIAPPAACEPGHRLPDGSWWPSSRTTCSP